jgi:D-amino-acid dehydrogenase
MPGVLASVPGMLLDDESPLYLPLRYLPRALPWLLRFVASARPAAVEASAPSSPPSTPARSMRTKRWRASWACPNCSCAAATCTCIRMPRRWPRTPAAGACARSTASRSSAGPAGIEALEPGVSARYQVGMYLADHATILNPFRYVQAMARAYTAAGGRIVRGSVARAASARRPWQLAGRGRRGVRPRGRGGRRVVTQLLAPLGVHLALESQRGYHLQFQGARDIVSRTVVLADRKVFVTPMEEGLRVGGTVEIGGLEAPPDARRAAVLGRIARETFRGLDDVPTTTWMGHRPCMPDSVPVVGPAPGPRACGWPPATATWA